MKNRGTRGGRSGSGALLVACACVASAWLIFNVSLAQAGYACLSNPCIYGICMDHLNSTFTCYCIDGYTGIHCQTNWDECWSSPCLNGATCLDGIASYNCTCADGFAGENCAENVDECSSNPCQNNGTCIDRTNGYSCNCHPGYSGVHCESDLAVCNATNEKLCLNGGACIEGPGLAYACACLPGWTGSLCNISINECDSSPCQNGAVCIDLHAAYACACPFGFTGQNCDVALEECGENTCENDALCLEEDGRSVCYCVPDFHGDRCQYKYDECLLGPGCLNGGTCIDGVDNYTCTCPPNLTGSLCDCLVTQDEYDCTYRMTTSMFTPGSTSFSPTDVTDLDMSSIYDTSTKMLTTAQGTTGGFGLSTLLYQTDYVSPNYTFAQDYTLETDETSYFDHSLATDRVGWDSTQFLEEDFGPTTETGDTTYSIPDFKFSYETTTDFWSEDTTFTDGPTTQQPFSEFNTTFYTGTTLSTLSSTDFHRTPSTLGLDDDRFRTQRSLTTEDADRWYSHSTEPNEIGPALYPTKFLPETETPPPSDVTSEDELTTIESTAPTKKEAPATLGPPMFPDCSKWPCLNGGSCFYSEKGPKCACRFGWEGELCQERQGVQTPALTGRSYLIHRLSNDTGAVIGVDIRTLAPTGLILYAAISPHLYMSTYLQDGLLKFQFSCGVQTMVFSEVKLHINNGYNINIMAIIEMGSTIEDLGKCTASLLVNNTLKMSGDQMTTLTIKQSSENLLYLGGLPDYLQPQIDIPVKTGITGCMRALQIDAVEVDIYNDAVEGEQITECSSLACLSNPCHGTATCVEFADTWNCLCPNGYVGLTCEQSVCLNNPCHFGATCVQYPGSGFLCLCPLGKHGLFCEHDLEVGQPSFFSSVNGLSSFIAYPLPTAIHNSFELRFRFVAEDADQISLMLFIGQDHMHDAMTDHFAVSFIKGYIALTWNLGSGPRRIFMSQPINVKAHLQQAHTVRLGRLGQRAWLTVDGLGNVTGTSPGRLTQLNTKPIIFIGGHNSENFSILPHDLPLHRGFLGCIFDVQLRAGRISLNLQKTRAAIGRGVGQCATTPCYSTTCHNGGACLNQGATFTCLCPDGWFGPLCSHRYNLCDFTRHNCSSGSTCVPLIEHYECDCPLGRSGKFCDKEEQLSDVSFSGTRSFLSIAQQELHLLETTLEFELKPEKERGLIMFSRNSKHNSFFAISLQGGVLELRLLTQGGSNGGEIIVVRSGRILGMNAWHKIQMSRFGRRVQLAVDGTSNSATLLTGQVLLATDSLLSIGGVSDLSELPNGAMAGLPIPFTGCLRKLMINDKRIQLDERTILGGRNIADCDGTACGGDICQHNGSCWLDISLQAHCNCPQEYTGEHCETQLSCMEVKCQNKGRCQKDEDSEVPRCHCPLGWTGSYCERESAVGAPRFQGDGYLIVDKTASGFKRRGLSERSKRNELEFVYVNFSTAQPEAMILWSAQESELIGIGVESGLLKLVWSWRGEEPSTTVVVPRTVVADGTWHDVAVSITAANITVVADQKATLVFNHHQDRLIATDGIFYLGGFPKQRSVQNETKAMFHSSFQGCISELAWSESIGITDFKNFQGENIASCDVHAES